MFVIEKNVFKLLILFFVFVLPPCVANDRCVLMVLPTHEHRSSGSEKLIDTKISDNNLTLIWTNTEYKTIEQFLATTNREILGYSSGETACDEIIGVVGDVDSTLARILHTLASRFNLTITLVAAVAPSTFLPVTNLALPNVLDMNPLSHYIETAVSFVDRWNWTRIGLITDNSYYYHFAAELLLQELRKDSKKNITPILTVDTDSSIDSIQTIEEYGTHIIVLAMDRDSACLVLEQAGKLNLTWHDYAWVVLSHGLEFLSATCQASMEGVFRLEIKSPFPSHSCGQCAYDTINTTFDDHQLSGITAALYSTLYDSILATALASDLDSISNLTYSGSTGLVKFREGKRLNNISIIQVLNTSELEIAYYNSELNQLNVLINLSASGELPQGDIVIVPLQAPLAVVVTVILAFIASFIFVTAVLIFYFYFRKEPEVKATSVPISLCMFIGCYLMLFSPLISFLKLNVIVKCNLSLWLNFIGPSFLLILAALFLKMARVYVIFSDPFSYKKKLCSNSFLFLYLLLFLLPSIIILILWAAIDPFGSVKLEFFQNDYVLISEGCEIDSNAFKICLILIQSYIIVVMIALTILAFKSSKIRHKHFEDTRATNAFTFFTAITMIVNSVNILLLGIVETRSWIPFFYILLWSVHFVVPVSCQMFLFVPKVYPLFKRCLFKR